MAVQSRKSQSQHLAERLRARIEQQQLPDGELFMTEAEVAEKYDVSRTVAREAVGQLRAIGLLEGRQRKGLIVRHPDPIGLFSASLPSFARSEHDLAELSRLRYVLEVGAIELAVKNATDEQIARLSSIAARFRDIANNGTCLEEEKRLDLAFHSLLLEMTGSKLVAGMQRVLVDFFHSLVETSPLDAVNLDRIAWEHTELASAIGDRDVERARAMLRIQIRRYLPETDTDRGPATRPNEPRP
ncbi:MAG: FadR family transcriptional regulator [Planctomycetaceae bacterium]|nr:MAG: FadR family transcriptional regulator [Planctomycetaceae bacterium]